MTNKNGMFYRGCLLKRKKEILRKHEKYIMISSKKNMQINTKQYKTI